MIVRWYYESMNLNGPSFSVSQETSCMFLSLLTHTRKFYLIEKRHGDHQASKLASLLLLKSLCQYVISLTFRWSSFFFSFVCLFVFVTEVLSRIELWLALIMESISISWKGD